MTSWMTLPASMCERAARRPAGLEALDEIGGTHHAAALARTNSTVPASTMETLGDGVARRILHGHFAAARSMSRKDFSIHRGLRHRFLPGSYRARRIRCDAPTWR